MLKKIVIVLVALVAMLWFVGYAAGKGAFGEHEGPGEPQGAARPAASVATAAAAVERAADGIGVSRPKQILFGDLHVHTTFSFDAFLFSLPFLNGEGAHPPSDACDFARYCSSVDFWSINDHAAGITPRHWRETVEAIRQCNDVAGDAGDPDAVAFLGWEWTQVGTTPENHWGHKNVVLAHTDDENIPARPIAALRQTLVDPRTFGRGLLALATGEERLHDLNRYFAEREDTAICQDGVPVRDLPVDCIEQAATPADLYAKLDDWGHDAIVIPHGTTWGFYTPPGSTWDKQLEGDQHDEDRQTLVEVYSGHGDSEVHRPWRAVVYDADGVAHCPEPSPGYLPSCWRAGEIIRERCKEAGESDDTCEARAVTARHHAANAGAGILATVPGASGADFLDAGQCTDCLEPSFNYRPGNSAQYMLAIGNFDEGAEPRRFRPGFMASSDNHFARPGTGYKEVHRRGNTESMGGANRNLDVDSPLADILRRPREEPVPESRPYTTERLGFDVFETERLASFLTTGGLIAAHSEGRDRASIWQAMKRREVYGTSGPRILLWFDLLNPPGSSGRTLPMGSEVRMSREPIFQVRAVGSFEQKPGCPEDSLAALSPERLDHLCKGECYNPGDVRRPITRIEIVRVRPQRSPDEDVNALIADPWRTFACDGDPTGCSVTFTDPEFRSAGRDALYYARVFEAPKPGINGDGLRCKRDSAGRCTEVQVCGASGDPWGDCLGEIQPRAWSSPIYTDFEAPEQIARTR
ncbi:MAG: DUF3604 domain-containing protein [Myxococcota bacterium]